VFVRQVTTHGTFPSYTVTLHVFVINLCVYMVLTNLIMWSVSMSYYYVISVFSFK